MHDDSLRWPKLAGFDLAQGWRRQGVACLCHYLALRKPPPPTGPHWIDAQGSGLSPCPRKCRSTSTSTTASSPCGASCRRHSASAKSPTEDGKVHIHYRAEASGKKELDRSFDIVRVHGGEATELVEGMAAQAHALTVLVGENVSPLVCPRCSEGHIDELLFATRPHVKHLCNACGRNFRDRAPSVSNPLGGAQARLGLLQPRPAQTGQPLPQHHVERLPRSRHLAIQ